ncbi:Sec1-like protein [Jimgerdemannia flammicorona]|uniref:Sec1-like protein n=1 Tax=Jimgerdemannia flammicorona TaxID=994334 RepID=A0A433P5N9_9FUNG|nr:Sec1-like protein [Jimgerdemannia flammicorona]
MIVDRTIDPSAPFLHEFTYQAMMNDLLPMDQNGTRYTYTFTQADGTSAEKEVVIEEADSIYASIRHLHIAECSDRLISQFNEFVKENKAAQARYV